MTQYINKDALVTEIESKFQKYWKRGEESDTLQDGNAKYWGGVLSCLNEVKALIDTLEVKEVNLEKELSMLDRTLFDLDGVAVKGATHYLTVEDVKDIAKHFFELGLNIQQNISINVTDIDKVIEENGVDPNSKEAKMFKESYYMALEKFKAQKGETIQ